MSKQIPNLPFMESNYKNHTITDLVNCLRKASTKEEQNFFVKLLNIKRATAAKKVID